MDDHFVLLKHSFPDICRMVHDFLTLVEQNLSKKTRGLLGIKKKGLDLLKNSQDVS